MHYANAFGNLNAIEEKYMTERFATQNEMHPYELADFDDFKTYYEAFIG